MQRRVPDVLAIFEEDLNRSNSAGLKDLLVSIGLTEFKAIRHALKGISIIQSGTDFGNINEELFFKIPGSGLGLKLEFEHMIIFTSLNHSMISH